MTVLLSMHSMNSVKKYLGNFCHSGSGMTQGNQSKNPLCKNFRVDIISRKKTESVIAAGFINDEVLISHWTAGVSKEYPWEMVLKRCFAAVVIW